VVERLRFSKYIKGVRMTFKEVFATFIGVILGSAAIVLLLLLISILIDGTINKNYAKYSILYEHNITIKQLPTKEYAKYILDRKYQESVKELEEQNADITGL
jgi:hypothetical protein